MNCIDVSMHDTVKVEASEVKRLPSGGRVQHIIFSDESGTELKVTVFLAPEFDGVKLAGEVVQ